MKVKDLMIGDYLKWNGEPYRVIQVTGVIGDSFMLENGMDDDVEPVPVTPEILKKNGFKDIGEDTWQLEEKPYWFWVDFYNHEYGCEFDTSTYEYEYTERRLKLYGDLYVHELQHAMKLCGIEKEIEL